MAEGPYKVFLQGKGTCTFMKFDEGKAITRLTSRGRGQELGGTFSDKSKAIAFATAELQKQPEALF